MGPHTRGTSSSSSHYPLKTTSSYSSHTSSSGSTLPTSSSHPLSGGGLGHGADGPGSVSSTTSGSSGHRRPRSRSTTTATLSSPHLTRLRLRAHSLLTQPPFIQIRRLLLRRPYLTLTGLITLILLFLLTTTPTSPLHLGSTNLRLPTHPLDPQASAAFSLTKPRVDQGGNEIPDQSEGQQEVEIQRSFEEPDFGLLSSKQPHEIGCEVPLDWTGDGVITLDYPGSNRSTKYKSPSTSTSSLTTPSTPNPTPNPGVLIFLGIFSAAQSADKSPSDMLRRRNLYREHYIPQFPPHLITVKFILGLPPLAGLVRNPAAAIGRAKVMRMIEEEQEKFGDLVILDMEDNIDSGKTHRYFQWVAKQFGGPGQVKGRPRFVMKSDDDTLLVMPNLISAFKDLDCSTNVYMGTSAGRSQYFGDYFRGLAYAMSWPLISWIGEADMPMAHITKIEDARTGQWLRHLDPVDDPIHRIDYGWTMGDWNQLDVGLETVALHWCKWDDWVIEQQNKIQNIWKAARRPFRWDKGIEPATSIAKGKITPEEAEREHQRQIEKGWDVEGNLKGDTGDG